MKIGEKLRYLAIRTPMVRRHASAGLWPAMMYRSRILARGASKEMARILGLSPRHTYVKTRELGLPFPPPHLLRPQQIH